MAGSASADVLYVSDIYNGGIYTVSPAGTATLFAQLPAGSAPTSLAIDAAGNLFVADVDHIDKVTPSGGVSVFASGIPSIFGVGFDAAGNLYASDDNLTLTTFPAVRKISADGKSNTVYATSDQFENPGGFRFAPGGDLYLADQTNHVFRIAPGGGTVTPIGTARDYADLALDAAGNVFATRYDQGQVNRITPGGVEATFSSGANFPIGVTFDSAGALFVTDGTLDADGNGRVLKIDASGTATPFATVPGAAAIVAQAPEPATTTALAALGVVLAGRRRRRGR